MIPTPIIVSIVTPVLLLLLAAAGAPETTSSDVTASPPDGRRVFMENCIECHGVSSAGLKPKAERKADQGPDLTGAVGNYEAGWIVKWVRQEVQREEQTHTKPFKGTDEELQALVDWLLEQKAEG